MAGLYSRSTYPGGASMTQAGGGDLGPTDQLRALLSREASRPTAPAAAMSRRPTMGGGGGFGAAPPMRTVIDEDYGRRRAAAELQFKALRDRLEREEDQHRMMSQGPPLKVIGTGPQQIPGLGIDTNALTGYQRQAFLPQGAHSAGMLPPSQAGFHGREPLEEVRFVEEFPNGTGAAFERQRMAAARQRSDAEYDRRRAAATNAMYGRY